MSPSDTCVPQFELYIAILLFRMDRTSVRTAEKNGYSICLNGARAGGHAPTPTMPSTPPTSTAPAVPKSMVPARSTARKRLTVFEVRF